MGALSQEEINQNQIADAKWRALPIVVQFQEEAEAFAWKHNLKWDVAGFNAMIPFRDEFFAKHGPLPKSGVKIG